MTPIFAEILKQRQRIINEDRRPEKVQIGMARQCELYQDEHLSVAGVYSGPGADDRDRILGMPVEYVTDPHQLEVIRVIPEGWEGYGQGATRA